MPCWVAGRWKWAHTNPQPPAPTPHRPQQEKADAEELGGRNKEVRDELEGTRADFAKAEAEVKRVNLY